MSEAIEAPTPEPTTGDYSHDKSYKNIFSYAELVQQLVEGFLPTDISQLIDFTTLENVSASYITPAMKRRDDDVVWKVSMGEQELYLYLLLEFQSDVDYAMPVRMMQYVAALYDALIKADTVNPLHGLPPVLPIVLYNGDSRWKVKTNINHLITCPDSLKPYQPSLYYYLLDEGTFSKETLNDINNVVASVFSIENVKDDIEATEAIKQLSQRINQLPNKQRIDRALKYWVYRYLKHKRPEIIIDDIELIEDTAMLATNVEKWFESAELRGEQRGRQEGRTGGMIEMFLDTLALRFPNFDLQLYKDKIFSAAEEQIKRYNARLFTAQTPEEVFADDDNEKK